MLENLVHIVANRCIWRTVALGNSNAVEKFPQYKMCLECDGYNNKCQYYFTQRIKYETK